MAAKEKHPPGPPMTLGNMRSFGLALMIGLTACSGASAAILTLACSGTIRDLNKFPYPSRAGDEPWTFSVEVNWDQKTVSINGLEPIPISEDEISLIRFHSPGLDGGWINRITGVADINQSYPGIKGSPGGMLQIHGVCKPVGGLF